MDENKTIQNVLAGFRICHQDLWNIAKVCEDPVDPFEIEQISFVVFRVRAGRMEGVQANYHKHFGKILPMHSIRCSITLRRNLPVGNLFI